MGRIQKLKRELIMEANRKLLNETGPLNIDEGQSISLSCISQKRGDTIDIDGRVDVDSRNVKPGYIDERGIYVEPDEVIPQFLVIKERGIDAGVLAGQDETYFINLEKIESSKLASKVGEGVMLTYYDDPYGANKYICKVINVTDQFRCELLKNGLTI